MILAVKALTSRQRMLGAKSLFRDRQLPLVKGLSVRVLAFGTVKFRQVVKAR
jgi:hypothetical protein